MAVYEHTSRSSGRPKRLFASQPSLEAIEPHTPGPLRVGSEATEVRRFLGREIETTWTCVEHEPHSRSAIECAEGPVPFKGTFVLEPLGRRTRFTWIVETRGPASRISGPLVGRATRSELEADSARLKELLEGGD